MRYIQIEQRGASHLYPSHQLLKLSWIDSTQSYVLRFSGDLTFFHLDRETGVNLSNWLLDKKGKDFIQIFTQGIS